MAPASPQPRPSTPSPPAIVLFDGDCALCSAAVNFISRRDRRSHFRYIPLQSPAGVQLLSLHALAPTLDSVVLVEGTRVSTRSTAALRIARNLGWPWKLLAALLAIPAFLRDPLYTAVARRRHWLTHARHCPIPPPAPKERCINIPPP